MNRPMFSAAAVLLSALLPLAADTIRLKNGRSVEGIIAKQTDTHVYLDLGVGSTTLATSAIRSIERSDEAANQAIRDGWRKKYYLHKNHVPDGMEALAADFAALNDMREAAIQARRHLAEMKDKEEKIQAGIDDLRTQIVAANRRIATADPKGDVQAYNTVITEHNALGAKLTVRADDLDRHRQTRQPSLETVSAYVDRLGVFGRSFTAQAAEFRKTRTDEESRYFLDQIAATLQSREGEMMATAITTRAVRGGAVVAVTLNGQVQGQFLVDTGAGMVTISEALSQRLKLDTSKAQEAEYIMADGRRVKARYVLLDSVSLGNARAERVEAAILPSPGDGLDGLLGMSFLRNFVVHFDGATGQLTLKQFDPK